MKRRLVTPQEILSLHYQGVHCLEVPPDAIITPGARDLMMALGFHIRHGPPPPPEPREESVGDRVRGIVAELAPGLPAEQREQVVRAVLAELGEER